MKNVKLIKLCPRGKKHLSLNIPFIKRRLVIKKIVTHSLTPVFSSFLVKLKNVGKAYLASFRVQYLSIELFFSKNFFTADMSKDWSFSSPKMVVIALLDKKLIFFFFVFLLRIWKFYMHNIPLPIVFPKSTKSLSNSKSFKSNTQMKIYCQLIWKVL